MMDDRAEIRMRCLELGWRMANDGKEPKLDEVKRFANELLAYVYEGPKQKPADHRQMFNLPRDMSPYP